MEGDSLTKIQAGDFVDANPLQRPALLVIVSRTVNVAFAVSNKSTVDILQGLCGTAAELGRNLQKSHCVLAGGLCPQWHVLPSPPEVPPYVNPSTAQAPRHLSTVLSSPCQVRLYIRLLVPDISRFEQPKYSK